MAAGFGVRVVHSGVWGFASSPIVTEDEIKRITRVAVEVAKASAIAKKTDLKLAQVQKYVENYVTPMTKPPLTVSQTDKQAWAQAIVDKAKDVKGVTAINVTANHGYEWRYFASSEGSYIEQELYTTTPNLTITAKVGDVTRTRNYVGVASMGGWEVAEATDFLASAERVANEAVEMCTAKPLGSSGLRDLILSPSHAMLTIHEIVAHATAIRRPAHLLRRLVSAVSRNVRRARATSTGASRLAASNKPAVASPIERVVNPSMACTTTTGRNARALPTVPLPAMAGIGYLFNCPCFDLGVGGRQREVAAPCRVCSEQAARSRNAAATAASPRACAPPADRPVRRQHPRRRPTA